MVAPAIDTAAEGLALRACASAAMVADDGRGVRGARTICRNALVKAGHRPAMAVQMAEAMARIGVETQRHAVKVAAAIAVTLAGCASPGPAPAGPGMRCTWNASVIGQAATVAAGVEVLGAVAMTSGPGWSVRVIDNAGRPELSAAWFVPAAQVSGCRP